PIIKIRTRFLPRRDPCEMLERTIDISMNQQGVQPAPALRTIFASQWMADFSIILADVDPSLPLTGRFRNPDNGHGRILA
ncbi:hypothetical protein K9B33_22745, partial [Sphingobium sp. 3R8]|uniref:hypothetical protein n=1 Tax=Sphingobium sp. 3R8 TaxID=2874921 RepID=UPI001CCEA930